MITDEKLLNGWYLGLDIGTSSVGFAATDKEYTILTKSGKLECGSRLFEDAQDASQRRTFRSSRRRAARRKVRIDLLQELFSAEMAKKDPSFFIRLNESGLHSDDDKKTVKCQYPLFNDTAFGDKEYYKKFPSIYHLRKHLLDNDEKDVRLLYLACHHLLKYRGHFLFSSFNARKSSNSYAEIIDSLNDQLEEKFRIDNVECIPKILKDKNKSAAGQISEINNELNSKENKSLKSMLDAMCGKKISLGKIWDELDKAEEEIKDDLKKFKFSATPETYDACLAVAETILNDNQLYALNLMKSFYDLLQLNKVMSGADSIAEAMVNRFEEHKADLKLLKKFIKDNFDKEEYKKMFRWNIEKVTEKSHASYVNYIGSNITHGKKSKSHDNKCIPKKEKGKEPVTATYADFLKYTQKLLEKANTQDGYKLLKEKIDQKTLCQIQTTPENSYIPHQLLKAELQAILERQKENFPFLKNNDHYGTVVEKILSILEFRIPYYVGPLSDKDRDKFAWIVRKPGKIYPWNFDDMVDKAESGTEFILRMTSKCTYLRGEDVIPQQSLLYQKYMLLNDLNNLKINGNRISQSLKTFLFNGIFQEQSSFSKKKIKDYLISQGKITNADTLGKENDAPFNASLFSLIRFKDILGDKFDEEMCENIIKWHTIFGDEKEQVTKKIEAQYAHRLTAGQIGKLGKLSFKGWGKFSTQFLNGITATERKTGETGLTIMHLLENTTFNLMEILNSDSYEPKFMETVDNNNTTTETVDYNFVAELYCSPTVKRSIWQAILISKELTKINKCPPEKVFIEVTRGEDKKQKGKTKSSRRDQIEALLKNATVDTAEIRDTFNRKTDASEFRSDKLYLYFTQLGKCMYSGEKIDLDHFGLYDIDHIYPQSKIKDDSLTNRVLVKRSDNAAKREQYPLADNIRQNMSSFWKMLKDKGFINAEKYDRLICSQELSPEKIGGFINRQLVSTNQAVKETANALKVLLGDKTKIVYTKAANVGEFRRKGNLVKCREVNNLHHAHDAYLNIVVGNVWDSVYGQYWNTNFTMNEDNALDKLFAKDRAGIWKLSYFEKITSYLFDNRKYLDKFPVTIRPYEKKGEFYDQTIHPKGKGQYELKKGLETLKYGGYTYRHVSYNCLIEHDRNGIRKRAIVSVPVLPTSETERFKDYQNYKIIIPKILMCSVLEIDGIRYHMRSGELQCSVAAEWYPDMKIIQIVHNIFKYKKLVKDNQLSDNKGTHADIIFATREYNKHKNEDKKISHADNMQLFDAIIEQIKKPFYAKYDIAKKIKKGKIDRKKFEALTTHEQVEQLIGLLNVITMNGTLTNALQIGGKKNETCKYKPEKEVINKNGDIERSTIYLITQSVTGLFENKILLNIKE